MKNLILLTALFVASSAASAAGTLKREYYGPTQEYCFVFVENEDGTTDRKTFEFELLDFNSRVTSEKIDVDGKVIAIFSGSVQGYGMSLYKKSDVDFKRPLATGSYTKNSDEILDFDARGFIVYTDDANYTLSCATMGYPDQK